MSELQTLVAILVFVGLLFGLYRLLVQQKDANIQVLRDQLAARDKRIQELETQSPDALLKNLSNRVTESLKEIERLTACGTVGNHFGRSVAGLADHVLGSCGRTA